MGASDNFDTIQPGVNRPKEGIFLAEVVGHQDKTFMGVLEVRLHRPYGNKLAPGQTFQAKFMSPFYGSTPNEGLTLDDDYSHTQKSYGMWFVPPDIGTTVIVIFVQDDAKYAYWIGCVPEEGMNFSVPGQAATKFTLDGEGRVPVAEYNRLLNEGVRTDITKILKPKNLLTDVLTTQGLIKDDIRGITTSSARREFPSSVFGISTPGPLDKNGPTKKIGIKGREADQLPMSRLGGTTFVMDDGDDKFIRKTLASEGPPEYSSVENTETAGLRDVPHNELVRIRTRTGHQILMHNSEDLIYIGNASGTTWIEMTSNGKIDIYAEDSISIHTEKDLNFKADRDINLEAGRNFNVKSKSKVHLEAGTDIESLATANTKITSGANSHINSGTSHRETAGKIYMNSSQTAEKSVALEVCTVPNKEGIQDLETIMMRVPQHEPWPHHENLDPVSFKNTDRESAKSIATPKAFKEYTTKTDTFEKIIPPSANQGAQ